MKLAIGLRAFIKYLQTFTMTKVFMLAILVQLIAREIFKLLNVNGYCLFGKTMLNQNLLVGYGYFVVAAIVMGIGGTKKEIIPSSKEEWALVLGLGSFGICLGGIYSWLSAKLLIWLCDEIVKGEILKEIYALGVGLIHAIID